MGDMKTSAERSILKLQLALVFISLAGGPFGESAASLPGRSAIARRQGVDLAQFAAKAASLAVPFVANAGRFPAQVKFSADLFSGRFFLTDRELVYSLHERREQKKPCPGQPAVQGKTRLGPPVRGMSFRESFLDKKGDRVRLKPMGGEMGSAKVSYFRGSDPAKWRSGLATHESVSLGEVYPGIRVELKATGRNVEKVFHVGPGGKAADIRIGVEGVKGLKIDGQGRLLLENDLVELAMRTPVAWQEIDGLRREVKAKYRFLGKNGYGFVVEDGYDKSRPLIIDPELDALLASTLFGGSDYEYIAALAMDDLGNIYLAGSTSSADFPTTAGAYDREINPEKDGGDGPYPDYYPEDLFVSKLDGKLSRLLASTYIGGDGDPDDWEGNWDFDYAYCLALDSAGNVYLSGVTYSRDFPTSRGAYDRTYNGSEADGDAFVAKLNKDLTRLLASTYLGGEASDSGTSLVLDASGNVFVSGTTWSADFPVTAGAYGDNPRISDAFVSKFDGGLTELSASTLLGGSGRDYCRGMAIDRSGNLFVTGCTNSEDFPTTGGSFDRTYNDKNHPNIYANGDVFVSRLDAGLSTLLASTYLGGEEYESGLALTLAPDGDVLLAGGTSSENFPTTSGAFDRSYNGGDAYGHGDVFVARLDVDLTRLVASTFLGGRQPDAGNAIAVDGSGEVLLAGETLSTNFPVTPGAYDGTANQPNVYNVTYDAFVSRMDGMLTRLQASTFLGGLGSDRASSLILSRTGDVFVAGVTNSGGFPTTPGAFARDAGGWGNGFVSLLNNRHITLISPNGGEAWGTGSVQNVAWSMSGRFERVRIELSADNGSSWNVSVDSATGDGSCSWTVPRIVSRQCRVRISDVDYPGLRDASDAPFAILMGIDLAAERRQARALSITRPYGEIDFLADLSALEAAVLPGKQGAAARDPRTDRRLLLPRLQEEPSPARAPAVAISAYRILRSRDNGEFIVVKTVAPSELENGHFRWQDKYLEEESAYTYRVEAVDADGRLVGISQEKSI